MASGPVISNTTPVINLVGVGLLEILSRIYAEIWIPEAVRDEYNIKAAPSEPDITAISWLKIQPTTPDPVVADDGRLGKGEVEAISLARASNARAILLVDRLARRTAADLGLPVVGTLAVLVRAKREGVIAAVAPVLDQMVGQGRYISGGLRDQVLREADQR